MTKYDRVRFYMFIRVVRMITDNIADFVAGGVILTQFAVLQTVIAAVETLTGEQVSGLSGARFEFNSKETARENLREALSEISRTARSMVYEFAGIDLKFRMQRNRNDADLLAKARSFITEATPLKGDFIRYEMDSNFLTALQTLIDEFEAAMDAPGTEIDSHVAATAEIGAEIRKGMIAVRTLNGAVKNKYRNDVGKLAAWLSASHIEKLAEGKEPTPPTS
ncbi:hypothetical protein BH10ACI1_BH10ACI1_32650 [soil metagenome]